MSKTQLNYLMSTTMSRYHMDTAPMRFVIGPVGGGKTVGLCMEILRLGMEQAADWNELVYPRKFGMAIRPSRWLLVRATYPQLKATLIKTFNEWTGKLGTIVYDSPIRFYAELPLPDGTLMQLEVLFMALDGPRAAENLRSLEVTGIGFSEFAEIGQDIFEMAQTRIGRFPKTVPNPADLAGEPLFGPSRACIIGESNPPSDRSHWYTLFEVTRPPGLRVFKQPPAMLYDHATDSYMPNPEAENIRFLPGGFDYYNRIIAGASPEFINIYVMNNYGTTFSGKPVYPMFDARVHVLGAREPVPLTGEEADAAYAPERRPIVLGLDLGLNPAASIAQSNALGGLTLHDEVIGTDVRFEDFLNDMLLPTLRTRFAGLPVLVVYDPANPRSSLGLHTAAQMLKQRGIAAIPAPTNDVNYRIQATTYYLQRTSMLMIHPRCRVTREGFLGGYCFEEVQGKDGVFKDIPSKGFHSHIMNGVEYVCSHFFSAAQKSMALTNRRAASVSQPAGPKKGFSYV